MKVALYARVSTDDTGQDPLNQLRQLREFAATQNGWTVTHTYTDYATGKNAERKQFQEMMKDAARRKFDVLLFWSLDRLSREGTFKTLCYLRQLSAVGIKYKSYQEQYLDTLGPWGEAIAGLLATVAELEARKNSERTKAGMMRVAAAGIKIGRPRKSCDLSRARQLREDGLTYSAIAKRMKVSRAVIWKRLNIVQGNAS